MKKATIVMLMLCLIGQPFLVLASELPPPGFSSIEEYNYARQCSISEPMIGCAGYNSSSNSDSGWGFGEVLLGVGAIWLLAEMAKNSSSSSSSTNKKSRSSSR